MRLVEGQSPVRGGSYGRHLCEVFGGWVLPVNSFDADSCGSDLCAEFVLGPFLAAVMKRSCLYVSTFRSLQHQAPQRDHLSILARHRRSADSLLAASPSTNDNLEEVFAMYHVLVICLETPCPQSAFSRPIYRTGLFHCHPQHHVSSTDFPEDLSCLQFLQT